MEASKTPLLFQRALAREVEEIAKDMLFQVPQKGKGGIGEAHIQAYCQNLPIPRRKAEDGAGEYQDSIDYEDQEEDAVLKCPWAVVKIGGGEIKGSNGEQMVKTAISFGIYNQSEENKGHEEVMNLIQRVYERFAKDPILDRQYIHKGDFEWALQEEDTYPYFFGAISMTFSFSGFRREIKYL